MPSKFSRIVVAYDDSELSKKAVKLALKLASTDPEAEIHVVSVFDNSTPDHIESHFEDILKEARQKTRDEMKNRIEEELKGVPDKTNAIILEGHPARRITEFAHEEKADLIVIGSRGLSNLQGIVLGSVSSKVMQLAHCPVLIVK